MLYVILQLVFAYHFLVSNSNPNLCFVSTTHLTNFLSKVSHLFIDHVRLIHQA